MAGVFPEIGSFSSRMNFMNGEKGRGPDGVEFSILLGGTPTAEAYVQARLAELLGAGHRVHFLDRSLTAPTLRVQGGISCRVKIEGEVASAP